MLTIQNCAKSLYIQHVTLPHRKSWLQAQLLAELHVGAAEFDFSEQFHSCPIHVLLRTQIRTMSVFQSLLSLASSLFIFFSFLPLFSSKDEEGSGQSRSSHDKNFFFIRSLQLDLYFDSRKNLPWKFLNFSSDLSHDLHVLTFDMFLCENVKTSKRHNV